MEKELKRIMKKLKIIYKGLNPIIEIFGDGSWSVEVDGTYSRGKCRIGGEASGDSIEELEEFLNMGKKKRKKSEIVREQYATALLSILDTIKLFDILVPEDNEFCETLSEVFFRKLKAEGIDLNKDLNFTHLAPNNVSYIREKNKI